MSKHEDLVASLPGSGLGGRDTRAVTNSTLMPPQAKLPGLQPPKAKESGAPKAEWLGSGNKIPESADSRMRSQFASPDPALYDRKKKQVRDDAIEQGGWSSENRSPSIPCMPYTTSTSPGAEQATDSRGRPLSKFQQKVLAEKAAKVEAKAKAKRDAEVKLLTGQKEALLMQVCTDPNVTPGHRRNVPARSPPESPRGTYTRWRPDRRASPIP